MTSKAFGPFLKLYCKEVLGDSKLKGLSDAQFGRWVRYLCVMQDQNGQLPIDPSHLSSISGIDVRKVRNDVPWLLCFFSVSKCGTFLRSDRLDLEGAKYRAKVDSAHKHGNYNHPEMGGQDTPEMGPEMGGQDTPEMGPEMGGAGLPRNRGGTRTYKETPIVPMDGDTKRRLPGNGKTSRARGIDVESTGDPVLDRYLEAAVRLLVAAWPAQKINNEPMPTASRSQLRRRFFTLVAEGWSVDHLRGIGLAYLHAYAHRREGPDGIPAGPWIGNIAMQAPQFAFGARGTWRDYQDAKPLLPLEESRIAETLCEKTQSNAAATVEPLLREAM